MIKTMERFVGDVAVSLRRPEGMNECPELGNGKAGPNVWKWVVAGGAGNDPSLRA